MSETISSLVNSSKCIFSGNVKRKRKLKWTIWTDCYVVLYSNYLYVFNSYNPLKTYSLKTSLLIYDKVQIRTSRSQYYSFTLIPLTKTFSPLVFGCVAPGERLKWVQEIHKAMMCAHNKTHSVTPVNGNNPDEYNVYDNLDEREQAIKQVECMSSSLLFHSNPAESNECEHFPSNSMDQGSDRNASEAIPFCSDSEFGSGDEIETNSIRSFTSTDLAPSAPDLGLVYDFMADASTNNNEDASKVYYQKCMFYGNREAASDVMRPLNAEGTFMVRVDNGRAVLTVRTGVRTLIKYEMQYEPGQTGRVSIANAHQWFDSLPHLLHHYHYNPLPDRNISLVTPYQLAMENV